MKTTLTQQFAQNIEEKISEYELGTELLTFHLHRFGINCRFLGTFFFILTLLCQN
jgi:hypothetical protein